ncbi:MAG: HPr family phosphocarrier protein [Zetaproteobacteria bacterium]|nr:MAG: HPr family phosphocarrier protein [Zetaproteobacteria bacterium]
MGSAGGEHRVEVTIGNRLGLHARASAKLVALSNRFRSEISITKGGVCVNGKSILGVMMLAAAKGERLTLTARGDDAEAAVTALAGLIADRFGEEA